MSKNTDSDDSSFTFVAKTGQIDPITIFDKYRDLIEKSSREEAVCHILTFYLSVERLIDGCPEDKINGHRNRQIFSDVQVISEVFDKKHRRLSTGPDQLIDSIRFRIFSKLFEILSWVGVDEFVPGYSKSKNSRKSAQWVDGDVHDYYEGLNRETAKKDFETVVEHTTQGVVRKNDIGISVDYPYKDTNKHRTKSVARGTAQELLDKKDLLGQDNVKPVFVRALSRESVAEIAKSARAELGYTRAAASEQTGFSIKDIERIEGQKATIDKGAEYLETLGFPLYVSSPTVSDQS